MLVTTATNTFNVRPGTILYVPVAQADDSPPILGDFPLADGGGTHYMTLAAFLTPLTPGTHTVAIEGDFSGLAVLNFFHAPVDFVLTYTVNVRIP
jgi:hypothetical protein